MALSELQARARFVQSAGVHLHFDEERWLSRVRRSLERDTAEALGAAAKVLDVPPVLRATRPEAYLPQHFALGPYHCDRPELRDMERYKLAAAKRAEKLSSSPSQKRWTTSCSACSRNRTRSRRPTTGSWS